MRPILALGGVFAVALVVGGTLQLKREKTYADERQECEQTLHVYAKHLEDSRRHFEPPRYPSCILELEQVEGKRNPDYYKYNYRVEGDLQSYELTCRNGHGGTYPAYRSQRGLYLLR